MEQTEGSPRSGTRDDILAILLGAAAVTAVVGIASYAVARKAGRDRLALPAHAKVASLPLKRIAEEAGVQPPTALAHLNKLQEEGKVGRVQMPEGPRYALLPFLRCEWVDPDHGIQVTWQSSRAVDWRFPLVTRIPDAVAQDFLLEWLDRAQARGLLPAYRSRFERQDPPPAPVQIVVYGSCARGDAHAKSDIDILVRGNLPKRMFDGLIGLAHEVALSSSRTPDVKILDAKSWETATPAFRDAVRRDGKTIFTNQSDGDLVERKHPEAAHA